MDNFFRQLKKPVLIKRDEQVNSVKEFFQCYLLCMLLILVAGIFLALVDKEILIKNFDFSIRQQLGSRISSFYSPGQYVLLVLFVGPIIEEMIFRLPLSLKKWHIAVSLFFISYYLFGGKLLINDASAIESLWKLSLAMLISVIFGFGCPDRVLVYLKQIDFRYYFYISAIAFALFHINSYKPLNGEVAFFYPLYVIPQFIMGIFLGFIRLRFSFLHSIMFHSMINLPTVLLNFGNL